MNSIYCSRVSGLFLVNHYLLQLLEYLTTYRMLKQLTKLRKSVRLYQSGLNNFASFLDYLWCTRLVKIKTLSLLIPKFTGSEQKENLSLNKLNPIIPKMILKLAKFNNHWQWITLIQTQLEIKSLSWSYFLHC